MITDQARWGLRMLAEGRCRQCGKENPRALEHQLCEPCAIKQYEAQKRWNAKVLARRLEIRACRKAALS